MDRLQGWRAGGSAKKSLPVSPAEEAKCSPSGDYYFQLSYRPSRVLSTTAEFIITLECAGMPID